MTNMSLFSTDSYFADFLNFPSARQLLVTVSLAKLSVYIHQYYCRQLYIDFGKFITHFLFPK